jgi:hypothetical protein
MGLGMAASSCGWERPTKPPLGYERDDDACSDRIDNDRDGLRDCDDPDCMVLSTVCGPQIPLYEPRADSEGVVFTPDGTASILLCIDGVDNDDDGGVDCGDRSCQSARETCCTFEWTTERCSDGLDNDRNGFGDCGDRECRNSPFADTCLRTEDRIGEITGLNLCTDGLDNDDDQLVDCEDPDCSSLFACRESDCDDGIDNNENGATDCDDASCLTDMACADLGPEDTAERCSDGVSNDGDNFVDCDDFDCDAFCETEDTAEACADGVDNDNNGFTDCNDFSCEDFCPTEETLEECSDMVDNDEDGFQDCEDNSCRDSDDAAVQAYCRDILEATFEKCTDGIDNDGNRFIDCDDRNCSDSNNPAVRQACQESLVRFFDDDFPPEQPDQDAINARCSDGQDNDLDGFVDCDDWDCAWHPLVTVCTGRKICE